MTTMAKPAVKMSFYSEEHAAKVNRVTQPTPEMVEAAKRVVFREPDAAVLARIVFPEADDA